MTSLALQSYKVLTPTARKALATTYPNVQQLYSKQILPSSKRKIVKNKGKITSVKALKAMTHYLSYYAFTYKHFKTKPNWLEIEQEFFRSIGINHLQNNANIDQEHRWPKYYWVLINTFRAAYNHIFEPKDTQYNFIVKNANYQIDYIDKKLKLLNVHKIYKALSDTKTLQNFQNNGY